MAFKMKYSKSAFPYGQADATLVKGARDAAKQHWTKEDEAKTKAISKAGDAAEDALKEKY